MKFSMTGQGDLLIQVTAK